MTLTTTIPASGQLSFQTRWWGSCLLFDGFVVVFVFLCSFNCCCLFVCACACMYAPVLVLSFISLIIFFFFSVVSYFLGVGSFWSTQNVRSGWVGFTPIIILQTYHCWGHTQWALLIISVWGSNLVVLHDARNLDENVANSGSPSKFDS